MKNRRIKLLSISTLLALLALLLYRSYESRDTPLSVGREVTTSEATAENNQTNRTATRTNVNRNISILTPIQKALEFNRALKDSREQFKTQIEFYGLVVDEVGQPVAAASALCMWTDLSKEGHSSRTMQSDANGKFILTGVKGYALSVRVDRTGYYTSTSNRSSFFYAGQDVNFSPDSENPVIFRLHRKRQAEPLVRIDFPGFAKIYQLKGDGKPVEFDLMNGVPVPTGRGHIQIMFHRGLTVAEQYDWRWSASVPKGGLVGSAKEFDFEAPVEGYDSLHEIHHPAASEQWKGELLQKYFLRFGDGTYARISFRLLVRNGVLAFESFVNPSGSRNLEYDPAVQPKAARQ